MDSWSSSSRLACSRKRGRHLRDYENQETAEEHMYAPFSMLSDAVDVGSRFVQHHQYYL